MKIIPHVLVKLGIIQLPMPNISQSGSQSEWMNHDSMEFMAYQSFVLPSLI